ncbi:Aste57867_10695 [Aphanomyces stellatus]|uniref:Aste57867_10695 protein n=1 Tax=Aphanomyces stellatus TaxID=120398 RepID=A0A485KSM7_9STRA|nr:hypothetical protein As57867_010655 [Aphanomyces stellatus]VFT87565.1 Aste57867_10695 [Aphanomyces stellatus]
MTRCNGTNIVVGFFNLSSVTYVYLSAVLLLFRTPFVNYGNTDNVGLLCTTEDLDGIRVDWFQSWYTRNIPEFVLVMTVNLICIVALDHMLKWQLWRRLARNSLAAKPLAKRVGPSTCTLHGPMVPPLPLNVLWTRGTSQEYSRHDLEIFGQWGHVDGVPAQFQYKRPSYDPMATTGSPANKYIVVKAKAASADVASLDETTAQATGALTDLEESAV